MPHVQPRVRAAKSPFDVNGVLDAVKRFNLLGIGGSYHEFGGQVGLMADEGDVENVVQALKDAGYADAKGYGEADGLHLDYANDDPGNLLLAVKRARAHHEGGVVSDIAVGVRPVEFWVDGNGDLIRDGDGNPTRDPNATRIEALPVQVFFLITGKRNSDGDLIG